VGPERLAVIKSGLVKNICRHFDEGDALRRALPPPSNLSRFRVCREANAAVSSFSLKKHTNGDRDNSLSPCRAGLLR